MPPIDTIALAQDACNTDCPRNQRDDNGCCPDPLDVATALAGAPGDDDAGSGSGSGYVFYEPLPFTPLCFGDGSNGACPCANFGQAGTGCANSTGEGAELAGFGETQVASDNYLLLVRFLPALEAGVFLQGAGLAGFPFRDGLLCVASPTVRLETVAADAGGTARSTVAIAAAGAVQPGDLRYYQFWYRDPGGACGTGSNFSNGWAVDWE